MTTGGPLTDAVDIFIFCGTFYVCLQDVRLHELCREVAAMPRNSFYWVQTCRHEIRAHCLRRIIEIVKMSRCLSGWGRSPRGAGRRSFTDLNELFHQQSSLMMTEHTFAFYSILCNLLNIACTLKWSKTKYPGLLKGYGGYYLYLCITCILLWKLRETRGGIYPSFYTHWVLLLWICLNFTLSVALILWSARHKKWCKTIYHFVTVHLSTLNPKVTAHLKLASLHKIGHKE